MASDEKYDFVKSSVRQSDELELLVQCNHIVKGDSFSSSDPFVRVYEKRSNWFDKKTKDKIEGFVLIGETEHLTDTPDPIFQTKFKIEYFFEETQLLRFECYDYDDDGKHDLLGSCEMNVGQILNSSGSIKCEHLKNKKGKRLKNKQAKMFQTITAELNYINASDRDIILQFKPIKLQKMDTFGSSDAYFKIYRKDEQLNRRVKLFNPRIVENNTNDSDGWVLWNYKKQNKAWPSITLSYQSLCDCDADSSCIVFEVWDADKKSKDDMIGETTVCFKDLQSKKDFIIKKAKHGDKERGTISIVRCKVLPTMVDFIQGGTDLGLACAIDFTGSNGDPQESDSLHFLKSSENGEFTGDPSQYQTAIRSIGNIIQSYDSDSNFPVFGFGLSVRDKTSKWQTYHSMELNRWINHSTTSEVHGVHGIEKLYIKTVKSIIENDNLKLSGPTNFSPVLNETFKLAKASHNEFIKSEMEDKLTYHILLLLTDGAISENDEINTKTLIVEAANEGYPLSIICVGIGDADFGFLETLDADGGAAFTDSMGVSAFRDIVQFVKFDNYNKVGGYEQLAKDTLKEIPKQFMSYVSKHNIPAPARTQALDSKDKFKLSEDEIDWKQSMYGTSEFDENDSSGDLTQQAKDPFLNAPLPQGWERSYTDAGSVYYINHETKLTRWRHPDDPQSKQV